MNTGSGEAAEQTVRMMLSGSETVIRLTGSAVKNLAAILFALAKSNKKLYGKTSLGKMLRETRDIRVFPMTQEQFDAFQAQAKRQKLLFAGIQDRRSGLVDLAIPTADVERANLVFERMGFLSGKQAPEREAAPSKKERRSGRDSPGIRHSSASRTTAERPSVEARLNGFREALNQRQSAPARAKTRTKQPERIK